MLNFFNKMLIGYVLIIFDFNVGIDIIPDIIGYLMIAHALTKLKTVKGSRGAFTFAIILGLLSIFEMPIFSDIWASNNEVLLYFYTVVYHSLELCYYYFIFEVCTHLLKDTYHEDYTKKVRNFILFTNWLVLLSNGVVLYGQGGAVVIFSLILIICAIASIIVYFIYFYKMKRYAAFLEEEQMQTNVEPTPL